MAESWSPICSPLPARELDRGGQLGNKRSGQVTTTASSGVNKTYIIVGAVIAAFVAGFIALVVIDSRQQAASSRPGEVETYAAGQAGPHTDGAFVSHPPTAAG